MNLGIITTQSCANVVPPPDTRCSDPEFARENPQLCPAQPTLVIKPSFALTCALGSIQFRAFQVTGGVEIDVTGQAIFTSSDPNTAVIGATSGNASGLAVGDVLISASYKGMSATAELDVLDCGSGGLGSGCQTIHVALMVVLDITKSMSLQFDGTYGTRLDFAKLAAKEFISQIDGSKDSIGLITFTDAAQNLLSPPTGDTTSVSDLVDPVNATQDQTSFFGAVSLAVSTLNATSADRKVILLISDGEDTAPTDTTDNNPFNVLADFKALGGIVMCLGVRSSVNNNGFSTLSQFSTGGFFVNAYPAVASQALDYITGLKGYVCAGNCTPAGDIIVNQGALNYNAFINWNVVGGNVDLLGNGFLDLLPGNGLYVDLGGSSPTYNGTLVSKVAYSLVGGHTYRITLWMAGNQQNDPNDLVARVNVTAPGNVSLLSQQISVGSSAQGLEPYSFNFTPATDTTGTISIQQQVASGFPNPSDPRWGLLLNEVKFEDVTDLITLLDDNFDGENPVYLPPQCGTGTTYVYLPSLGHYGYAAGYNCYGGYGCLDNPPGIQLPDPVPLSEIESGSSPPPQQFSSTKTQCVSCPGGSTPNSSDLIPAMTGYTTPSGVASASSEYTTIDHSVGLAWQAFLSDPPPAGATAGWLTVQGTTTGWLMYQFPAAKIVQSYIIKSLGSTPIGSLETDAPRDWTFEGSNDGATWTVLDTQVGQVFQPLDSRPFAFTNSTAYLYYRINITLNNGSATEVGIRRLEMYASASQSCATATEKSTISQNDADSKANASALAAAQAALSCTSLYSSTQSYTAKCGSGGTCGADVTKQATATSFVSQAYADADATAMAKIAAQAALDCSLCNNNYTMTVADPAAPGQLGIANPWPSCACISGMTGLISNVTVTLISLYHTWPSDLHALLMGPDGTVIYLFGHAGDGVPIGTYLGGGLITGPVVTFDDAAGGPLPNGLITTGSYQPTDPTLYGAAQLSFPTPAPQGSPGMPNALSTFNGKDPNGSWSLWVIDAAQGNTGGIAGGWAITITTA
jgi:hypothetical protein